MTDIVRLTIPVAEAVAAAHRAGVLHCDLKPTNVLRRTDGHVFLTDFGFARGTETSPSMAGGTAGFLAPEQVSTAFGEIGPQTDVYGLGALMYGLLTGQPPFAGGDLAETLAEVLSSKPVDSPAMRIASVPAALEKLCLACLVKEPANRLATAGELVASLKSISAD